MASIFTYEENIFQFAYFRTKITTKRRKSFKKEKIEKKPKTGNEMYFFLQIP